MSFTVELLKFFHVLVALTLFGFVLANLLTQLMTPKQILSPRIDQLSLLLCVLLMITASMLVVPEGYTFTTPWINAAFIYLAVVMLQLVLACVLKVKKPPVSTWVLLLNYGMMIVILMGIIHDAVTKHTLWASWY